MPAHALEEVSLEAVEASLVGASLQGTEAAAVVSDLEAAVEEEVGVGVAQDHHPLGAAAVLGYLRWEVAAAASHICTEDPGDRRTRMLIVLLLSTCIGAQGRAPVPRNARID